MLAIIYTTMNSKKESKKIINILLQKDLIACAQISKIKSVYKWESKICKDKEYLLLLKTKRKHYKTIKKLIKKYHKYEIPEIFMQTKLGVSKQYWQWLKATVC